MLKENAHCSECQVIVSLHKSIVLYYMLLCDLKKGESNMYRRDDYITGPSRQNSVGLCAISIIVMVIHYVIVMIEMFMDNGNDFLRDHPANKIQEIFISITQDGTACLVWEITAVILFVAAAISLKRSNKRDMPNTPALLAQIFSLLTALPLVYYVKQFFEWLPENWTDICQSCFEHRQIILFIVTLVVFVVIDFFLIRNRFRSHEFSIFGNKDSFLNYLFFCVILLHEVRFLWNYAGIGHFIVSAANSSVQERITLTFFVLFLIALIAVMIHCKRKDGQLSLLMWINIGGCIWGMTPVLYSIGEKEGLFHKYSIFIVIIFIMALLGFVLWNLNYQKIKEMLVRDSKTLFKFILLSVGGTILTVFILEKLIEAFGGSDFAAAVHIILQILALLAAVLVVLLLLTVLVKAVRNLRYFRVRDTGIWKEYMKDMKKGHRIFLYGYIAACFLVLCLVLIFFLERFWLTQQKLDDLSRTLPQIIILIILAVAFAITVIFALCQIGIYIVRTIKEIEDTEKNQKTSKLHSVIHGMSSFFALVLSIISWYIYAKIDFTEETAIGVAGDAFRYFAFPLIVLLWYAIMYYLLSVIFEANDEKASKLKKKIKKHAYKLAGDFVEAIFAPFSLFCNFFVELFKSMKNDDEDEDEDEQDNEVKDADDKRRECDGYENGDSAGK